MSETIGLANTAHTDGIHEPSTATSVNNDAQ